MIQSGSKKYTTSAPYIIRSGDSFYNGRSSLIQTKALITRIASEGFTMPDSQGIADIDYMINEIIDMGMWDTFDYFGNYAHGSSSMLNPARINWKRPFDPLAVINGGVTYDVNGFKGNGVNGYISLNHNPVAVAGNYKRDDAYLGAVLYAPGAPAQEGVVGQVNGGGASPRRMAVLATGVTIALNINNANVASPGYDMSGTGYKGIARNNANNIEATNKAAFYSGISAVSVAVANESNVLFRHNNSYGLPGICCFFSGGYISNTKAQAFRTAYNRWLTKKGLTPVA